MLEQELLDILRCPKCKSRLSFAPQNETLTCERCKAVYRVKDGIPVMLPEDSAS